MLEECVSYLEACIYNIKIKKVKTNQEIQGKSSLADRINKKKYECKSRIQLCALLSQLGQHENALNHGKMAIKKCESIMNDCLIICTDHLYKHKQKSMKFGSKKLLEKSTYAKFHELVIKVMPMIEYILNKLKNKKTKIIKVPKLDSRTALGVQKHNDWIYNYNIGDMMLLQSINITQLKNTNGIQAELTRDMMLEKVLMTVVSHFCLATEIRFLVSANSNIQTNEGKIWHKRALEFGQSFLPSSCPLYLHITNSYMRNYSEVLIDSSKLQEKKAVKKYKNKTPNPELKRLRSTSALKIKPKEERPSTTILIGKRKASLRIGDRTPPARTIAKDTQFNFNSSNNEKNNSQMPKVLNSFTKNNESQQNKKKISNINSTESDLDQEIIISSYDLYGSNTGDDNEDNCIDSTGGKMTKEPIIISGTGGNSCLFKS